MSELHTIFNGPEEKTESKNVAAIADGFHSENEKAREVQQIVADLAKNKTAWLREPANAREYVRGWASLR